jgi:hypothetical protein
VKDHKLSMLECVSYLSVCDHSFVSCPVRTSPGVFHAHKNQIFFVAKFTILTPLSLLSWCRLWFPIVALNNPLASVLHYSLLTKFYMVLRKVIKNLIWFLIKIVFCNITFLLTWFMHIWNNDITPAVSQNYMWYPITNKLHFLNCWYCCCGAQKILLQLMIFCFIFHRKKYNSLLLHCPFCPT